MGISLSAVIVLAVLTGDSPAPPPPFSRIDVLQLIEEAVEGSWIGHRARLLTRQQESEIGTLYAPPRQDGSSKKLVEVVIEIGDRLEVGNRKAALLSRIIGTHNLI